jgi:hypothetical protein
VFRYLSGRGAGIPVTDILLRHTYSPHWKEFSKKELAEYFVSLSPDFEVRRQQYFSDSVACVNLNWKGVLVHDTRNFIPFFRNGIYSEIDLAFKKVGITIQPEW